MNLHAAQENDVVMAKTVPTEIQPMHHFISCVGEKIVLYISQAHYMTIAVQNKRQTKITTHKENEDNSLFNEFFSRKRETRLVFKQITTLANY